MVDLPDPDSPLKTTSWFLGIEKEMFFRLWRRAPRIVISDMWVGDLKASSLSWRTGLGTVA